jgi:hypothetical protein
MDTAWLVIHASNTDLSDRVVDNTISNTED